MSDELRVVLVGAAKAAHDQMLKDAKADGRTTINSSKLERNKKRKPALDLDATGQKTE